MPLNFFNYCLPLLIFTFFCQSLNAQFTQQRTFSIGKEIRNKETVEIEGEGYITAFSTNTESTPFYITGEFDEYYPTFISKINYNLDTIWTLKLNNFFFGSFNKDNDNNLILCGSNIKIVDGNRSVIFNILKMNNNGNILNKKSLVLINNAYGTGFSVQVFNSLICTNTNNYITKISLNHNFKEIVLLKFDTNLNLSFSKTKRKTFVFNPIDVLEDNYLFDSKLVTDSTNIYFIPTRLVSPSWYPGISFDTLSRTFYQLDFNGETTSKKYIKDSGFSLTAIYKINNKIKICGQKSNGPFNGGVLKKPYLSIIHFDTTINVLRNNYFNNFKKQFLSKMDFKLINNKIHIFSVNEIQLGISFYVYSYTLNVNDSLSNNIRLHVLKLKDDLSIDWSSRVSIYGFKEIPIFVGNPFYATPETYALDRFPSLLNLNAFYRNNKLNMSFNKIHYNFPYSFLADSTNYKKNVGITFSSLDTTGLAANCNITEETYTTYKDTVAVLDLPFTQLIDTIFPEISQNIILNKIAFQFISDTCLPLKKPKSRFVALNNSGYGFSDDVICENNALTIYESGYNEPRTWHWILPPQVNISQVDSSNFPNLRNVKFNTVGTFDIKLVTENAAGIDTFTKTINVINFIPQPKLGNDTLLCFGDSLKIKYIPPQFSMHYFSGPGFYSTDTVIYIKNPGTYIIAAYTSCGFKYDTIKVNFAKKPKANFGFSNTCANLTVAFTDSSLLNFNPSLAYVYAYKPALAPTSAYVNFANTANPSFTFSSYDSFDVRLIVTSPLSCVPKDTITKRLVLKAKPVASFNYVNTCGSLQAAFTNNSSIAAGSISSYNYFLNGSLISNNANFNYSFPVYNNYIIKQVVQSNFGCISDTAFATVVVKDKPVITTINYTTNACANRAFNVASNASVNAATITNYYWQLNTATALGVITATSHTTTTTTNTNSFNLPTGNYIIKHWALSSNGCFTDTFAQPINVQVYPTASFITQNGCVGNNVILTNNSIGSGSGGSGASNIALHSWAFGNLAPTPATLITGSTPAYKPTYAYPNAGNFNIQLQVQTSNGCADSISQPIIIETKPNAAFTISEACLGKPITINNLSNNVSGVITSYTWQSNGFTSNAFTPNFTYNSVGSYSLLLTVSTANNCSATTTQTINIQTVQLFTTPATDTVIAINQPLQLLVSGAANYTWQPSSFLSSNVIANPIFTTPNNGNYILNVLGTTTQGCQGIKNIAIKAIATNTNVLIPNAFTPNADGLNDRLRITCLGLSSLTQFTIYNRWGNKVYQQNACNNTLGWDGKLNGIAQPNATYVYTWAGVNAAGVKVGGRGTVTLVR